MQVLFAIMVFHPVVGGTEQQAKDLAAALARRGHEVDVVTLRQPGCPATEVLSGVRVFRSLRGLGRGIVFAISYMLSLAWFLARRRKRYDVIQVYFAYLEAVAVSLMRPWLGRAGVVVRLSGGDPVGDLSRLRRLKLSHLFVPLIKRLDRFIVVSRKMRDELIAAGFDASRIVLIPNGVETDSFAASSQRAAQTFQLRDPARRTVLSVARLSAEKGLDVLLEAWKQVVSQTSAARLVLVGDGPERGALERQARESALSGSLVFAGQVRDVRPFLQHGDLFVLPSRSEGLPNALLQAMSVGLPCIASRVGGVQELITDGVNGRLVEPEDPRALAEALRQLLSDQEEAGRLGAAARQTVEQHYSFRQMVDRYAACYRDVCS